MNTLNENIIIYIQLSLLIILLIFCYILFKCIKKEERLAKYTVNLINSKNNLENKISTKYPFENIIKLLNKSKLIVKHSKKFDKYKMIYYPIIDSGIEIYSIKIFISMILGIIYCSFSLFKGNIINIYELSITFLIGYFIFNIILFIKYKIFRNKIENDFLKAIVVMNNAFKSGKNIYGAIDAVGIELDGVIANEFNRMSLELSFGLDIEIVFKRFSKRIKIKEVNYLTSTLSILNKTGGNIVKIFDSIEKNLYMKKELKLELVSLTSGSRIIIYAVSIIPILYIMFINLFNKDYFKPFFTTNLGFSLMAIAITIYILYILSIKKILKVGNNL